MFKVNALHGGATQSDAVSVAHASETHCMLHYKHWERHDQAGGRTVFYKMD